MKINGWGYGDTLLQTNLIKRRGEFMQKLIFTDMYYEHFTLH